MDQRVISTEETCEECMRIKCKECSWIASDKEALLIQQEILTACPVCGWKPQRITQ